jgi:hypothetical protein
VKYFTKQLWSDLQESGEAGLDASRRWDENAAAYVGELDSLRERLPPDVFDFFKNADVHDGALQHLRIRDFDPLSPSPADEPDDAESDDGPREGRYQVTVELIVCTSDERFDTQWTLLYGHIRRILVDFPTASPLFFDPGGGFEDWGYHELSDVGDGFLRHEVLFSSGAVVLLEFRDLSVERVDRPSLPTAS